MALWLVSRYSVNTCGEMVNLRSARSRGASRNRGDDGDGGVNTGSAARSRDRDGDVSDGGDAGGDSNDGDAGGDSSVGGSRDDGNAAAAGGGSLDGSLNRSLNRSLSGSLAGGRGSGGSGHSVSTGGGGGGTTRAVGNGGSAGSDGNILGLVDGLDVTGESSGKAGEESNGSSSETHLEYWLAGRLVWLM